MRLANSDEACQCKVSYRKVTFENTAKSFFSIDVRNIRMTVSAISWFTQHGAVIRLITTALDLFPVILQANLWPIQPWLTWELVPFIYKIDAGHISIWLTGRAEVSSALP